MPWKLKRQLQRDGDLYNFNNGEVLLNRFRTNSDTYFVVHKTTLFSVTNNTTGKFYSVAFI